jgi:hypothetical protein
MFAKDQFDINLQDQTVTCPNGITIPIRAVRGDKKLAGKAEFGMQCRTCPRRRIGLQYAKNCVEARGRRRALLRWSIA